jgi:hypothetical protein
MTDNLFAYSLITGVDGLVKYAGLLPDPAYWAADLATFQIGEGLPGDWKETGAVFCQSSELRWKLNDTGYELLWLCDQPQGELAPLPGDWQSEKQTLRLQNLNEPRLRPQFSLYPHGSPAGEMEARLVLRDGVAVFTSLRRLTPGKEAER